MAALSPVQAGIAFAGGCEVAWEPNVTALTYHVYRASTSGGSFSQIALVNAPTSWYLDSGYNAGNVYKVSWDNGTESPLSVEIVPTPCHDVTAPPSGRHDQLFTGSTTHLAHYSHLHFSQVALAPVVSGPTSTAGLFDDTFQAGSPLATLVTGTLNSCGSGSCSVSASGSAWALLRYPGHIPAPAFGITVNVTSLTAGASVLVGYGTDATHGVYARYNDAAHTIDIYGQNGAGVTTLLASSSHTLSGAFKLSLECCHNVYVCWLDTGSGWSWVGSGYGTNAGTYDLRYGTGMATWSPAVLAGNGAGSTTTVLSRMRACIWSGTGGMREMQMVTDLGGAAIATLDGDGTYYLAADRVGPLPPSLANTAQPVGAAIMKYNPTTKLLTDGAVANLTYYANSQLQMMNDPKVIYDSAAGGFHIWANDWTAGDDTNYSTPTMYYGFVTGDRSALTGWIHLASPTTVTFPASGVSTLPCYGCDVMKIGSIWYMAVGDLYTTWYAYLLSGSSPSSFSTVVASDKSGRASEGFQFVQLGTRLYIMAGRIDGGGGVPPRGQIYVWDISSLTMMTYMGLLDYPNPMLDQMPQQPTIVWFPIPAPIGGRMQLLGFQDNYYTRYQDAGPMQVCSPSFDLIAPQFTGGPAPTVGWRTA